MKTLVIATALSIGLSCPAFAQSAGAGGTGQSAAGAGGVGQSAAGAGGAGQTTGSTAPGFFGRGFGQSSSSGVPGTGGVDTPRRGVGTAPNGLPIGSIGSGLGSPEQPINSGSR
jgi:hypothetical protein